MEGGHDQDLSASGGLPRAQTGPIERHGAWVLGAAGIVAWALAAWQAEHDVVAGAWAASGFALILAAAFFTRVIKVTKEGVELAEVQRQVIDTAAVAATTAIEPDDTTDEARLKIEERVVRSWFDDYLDEQQRAPEPNPFVRANSLQRHYAGDRARYSEPQLLDAFGQWLEAEDWEVVKATLQPDAGWDLMAQRGDELLFVDVRAAVRHLSAADVDRIGAGRPPEGRFALVVGQGARVSSDGSIALGARNIEVYAVDPDEPRVYRLG